MLVCQAFTDTLPLTHCYAINAMSFYANLKLSNNILCREISAVRSHIDIALLTKKYASNIEECTRNYRAIV